MEREANLPAPSSSNTDRHRTILAESHPSSSFGSSSSPPDFLRHVQAAFKRHRPLSTMQSSSIRPRRILVPRREPLKTSTSDAGLMVDTGDSQDEVSKEAKTSEQLFEQRKSVMVVAETPEDSSITPPSLTETITKTCNENMNPFSMQKDETNPSFNQKDGIVVSSPNIVHQHKPTIDCQKKVQFDLGETANSHRAHEQVATTMDNLSSHMSSLALTEMELDESKRGEGVNDQDLKQRDFQQTEMSNISLRSDGGISSLLAKRNMLMQDQQHQFNAFLGKDISLPMTQPSLVASSCMTTTSVHSRSAPMLNSTTYSSNPCQDSNFHKEIKSLEDFNTNPQRTTQGGQEHPSCPTFQCTSGMSAAPTQLSISAIENPVGNRDNVLSKGQLGLLSNESDRLGDGHVDLAKDSSLLEDKSTKVKGFSGDVTNVQSQAPLTNNSTSNMKLEPSKSDKPEKAASAKGASASRKKNYDPELFFKVNGKLYQKLGKIGSGGSSEVYKVITSDCTIYALKRIKLKGRDYSTAYGFCQEIEYLNKLKGKNNIIQMIDYEVTDKTLLEEVLNGSMSIKDGRIRDDGYIYMVLEYGEIDLASMLSLKWKEMDGSSWNTDENWLRFYWQQILQAVSTIHEERIVHSDLKPANFLLVRGSLKLIDFGIAKAILSDTTNIQRDSQVGTLSYMSPEAFMCNENDANGNAIKCGRPSDIWSLGCILYQMVYGRTPFSEYKTFWAKFKVITDRNHNITYAAVSNPWLLDLMKKCLAWDRNERWRIPQLLQHPFLVPPIPTQFSTFQDQHYTLLHQIAETYGNDHEAYRLCSHLQQLLTDSASPLTSHFSTSRDQHCVLLSQMSRLCSQLQQHLAKLEKR